MSGNLTRYEPKGDPRAEIQAPDSLELNTLGVKKVGDGRGREKEISQIESQGERNRLSSLSSSPCPQAALAYLLK